MAKLKNSTLATIKPKTDNQAKVFEEYAKNKNLILSGCAGTGKTFLLCYLTLKEILYHKNYERIVIIRSAVASRDMGHLPGTIQEKMEVYSLPYQDIFSIIRGNSLAYQGLVKEGLISFESTSFLRGMTISNSLIIVDEYQNMNFHELDTIITRVGDNSKIFFSGDMAQCDIKKAHQEQFLKIVKATGYFSEILFDHHDIVRSGLVKEYITQKYLLDG